MTARFVPEWIGRTPESMPGIRVQLRVCDKQDGKCGCGCGRRLNFNCDQIDCDHIIPLKDGGENRETNLQLLLKEHHAKKTRVENIERGIANQFKAKAFTSTRRPKMQGPKFRPAEPQHRATSPLVRKQDRP